MNIDTDVRQFVAENFLFTEGAFAFSDDASFLREGIIDSLGVMELVAFVEGRFGIRVASSEITPENFDSVNKLTQFIRGKMLSLQVNSSSVSEKRLAC